MSFLLKRSLPFVLAASVLSVLCISNQVNAATKGYVHRVELGKGGDISVYLSTQPSSNKAEVNAASKIVYCERFTGGKETIKTAFYFSSCQRSNLLCVSAIDRMLQALMLAKLNDVPIALQTKNCYIDQVIF